MPGHDKFKHIHKPYQYLSCKITFWRKTKNGLNTCFYYFSLAILWLYTCVVLEPKYHRPQPMLNQTASQMDHLCHMSTGHLNFHHNALFATRTVKLHKNIQWEQPQYRHYRQLSPNFKYHISSSATANFSRSLFLSFPPKTNSYHYSCLVVKVVPSSAESMLLHH